MRIKMRFDSKWLLLLLVSLVIQQNVDGSALTDVDLTTKLQLKQEITNQIVPEMSQFLKRFDDILVPDVVSPAVADPVIYCFVPEDKLQEIQNVFDSAVNVDTKIVAIKMVSSSKCSEVEKIKSRILKLKLDLHQLTKNIFSTKYQVEKDNYEDNMRNLQQKMDEALKIVSDADMDIVTKLINDMQSQNNFITAVLLRLEGKVRELSQETVRLCVSELKANRIDAATVHYRDISDKTQIKEIVSSAYENADSFKIIFNFIRHHVVDSMSVLNGFTALFDSIKTKTNVNTENFVNIENLIIFINGVSKYNGSEFEDLAKSLYGSFRSVNYDDFFVFFNRINHQKYYETYGFDVKTLMQIFVRGALNNDVSNVVTVLDMKTKLRTIEDRLVLLNALMQEMVNYPHLVNSKEMMIMIYDVMEIRQEVDSSYNVANKQAVNDLYNAVPDPLKSLMYNNLCIRNIANGDYVYSGPQLDDKRRNLYASKRVEPTTANDETFVFQAQFIDRGRKLLFKNKFGEHLYFSEGESPRRVLSWTGGSLENDRKAYFMVERTDDMGVRVRSVEFNEYMHAQIVGKEIHVVAGSSGVDALWSLETCPFHYNI